ncbi:precorrin-6x reductase [Rhodobacter ferrooxidans]|uniref:Precorrin-6x reductase n=1 Tax=Rhodobacter ferrooxidans TaxID=371731 RepID=C8S2S4_9RHOB|nr:precorrin-6x reductase [Rhodobacter sp. SW2]
MGGTTEASSLARALAHLGTNAVFSYAGRTAAPVAQPLPTRIGGFGGPEGLAAWLRAESISHVIDATHPFAAQMSRNAVQACAATGTPLLAYQRSPWVAGPGDDWREVAGIAEAVAALPDAPARVFLAIGKQHLTDFAAKPQHHYLLRLVDAPQSLPLPDAAALIARGPFTLHDDLALLKSHAISHIVAKNAGGSGARAKLDAARALHLPVILIRRPDLPARQVAETLDAVLAWLHGTDLGV